MIELFNILIQYLNRTPTWQVNLNLPVISTQYVCISQARGTAGFFLAGILFKICLLFALTHLKCLVYITFTIFLKHSEGKA